MDEAADEDFFQAVAALKHDLAKYVAWRSANLPEEAWGPPPSPELVDALAADILRTRTQGDRVLPAWRIYESFREHCAGDPALTRRVEQAPELAEVDRALADLREARPALEEGSPEAVAPHLSRLRSAQDQIRQSLKSLHRRLREEAV